MKCISTISQCRRLGSDLPGGGFSSRVVGSLSYTVSAECKQNDAMVIVMHRWAARKELIFNNENNYDIIHENMNATTHVMIGRFFIMPTFQMIFHHNASGGNMLPRTGSTNVESPGHTTYGIRHYGA